MSRPISSNAAPKCAQCRTNPIDPAYRPFCSKRCANVDLGQWLKGGYAIPGERLSPEAYPDDGQEMAEND